MAIARWWGFVILAGISLGWAGSTGVSSAVGAEPLATFVEQELPVSLALYKHFHTHPELSHQEFKTAERLAAELKAAGCEVTTGVGGTGVVALIRNGDGPVVMVRGDMDALPVTEQTGVAYASTVQAKDRTGNPTGVMHACGHDIHTTLLVGVARYFVQTKANWKGTLMLIGQPAEEVSGGASGMLKDGLFTRFPKPTYAIAPHVDARLEAGKIGYRAGYALANVDSVDVTLYGKGGHGAYPQGTIDPIVMAARFVLDLQTIISRENPPLEPAVITVGAIHAGTKHNIISDRCHLQITVRSYSPEVRDKLLKAIERKAKATADSAGAKAPKVEFSDYTPALKNDEALVERLVPVFAGAIGADNVQKADQSLGGEDFSEFGLAGVPVFQFRLGSVGTDRLKQFKTAGEEPPSLHSPFYYPDPEPTLRTGLTALIAACEDLLSARAK
jgi:amidohydrolase